MIIAVFCTKKVEPIFCQVLLQIVGIHEISPPALRANYKLININILYMLIQVTRESY